MWGILLGILNKILWISNTLSTVYGIGPSLYMGWSFRNFRDRDIDVSRETLTKIAGGVYGRRLWTRNSSILDGPVTQC